MCTKWNTSLIALFVKVSAEFIPGSPVTLTGFEQIPEATNYIWTYEIDWTKICYLHPVSCIVESWLKGAYSTCAQIKNGTGIKISGNVGRTTHVLYSKRRKYVRRNVLNRYTTHISSLPLRISLRVFLNSVKVAHGVKHQPELAKKVFVCVKWTVTFAKFHTVHKNSSI